MFTDAKKYLTGLDRIISPPPPLTAAQQFEARARHIAAMAKNPLASPAAIELLSAKVKEHGACLASMNAHGFPQSKRDWLLWEEKLRSAVRNGTADQMEAWSARDFQDDYARVCEQSKLAGFDVSRESAAMALPIVKRFAALCNDLADEVESREKIDALRFGLPHTPSATVTTLRQTGVDALQRCNSGGFQSPRAMVIFLDL